MDTSCARICFPCSSCFVCLCSCEHDINIAQKIRFVLAYQQCDPARAVRARGGGFTCVSVTVYHRRSYRPMKKVMADHRLLVHLEESR